MNRPWMPLYVGDYLGDTGHLTTTQHGAYLLLMMHYWRKGELPDDDRQLSKITKLPLQTWCEYRPTLQDFFHEGWKHKRIDAELAKMVRVSEKRAIAGQKGGLGSALARMKLENASRSGALSGAVRACEQLPLHRRARPRQPPTTHTQTHIRVFWGMQVRARRRRPIPHRRQQPPENPRSPSARSLRPMSPGGRRDRRTNHQQTICQRNQTHSCKGVIATWHGPNATSRTNRQRFTTGDPAICRATPKSRRLKWTILWRSSPAKRSSRCVRSATIPWAGCIRHRQIDEAQYQGGRAFQDDWEKAERGPQAVDPTREYVDGGQMREPITEAPAQGGAAAQPRRARTRRRRLRAGA